eukprot:GILI01031021.1.p1 GENE.GILI01031021.1~~GILI01031021.1.p1  ORF type:complete len:138 (+),score=14.38 GILI01031021.1:93-506(+)
MFKCQRILRHGGGDSRIFNKVYMDAIKGPAPGEGAATAIQRAPATPKLTFSGQPMPRRSGLQWEVLGLYRQLQKAAEAKIDVSTRSNMRSAIRQEFRKEAGLPRRNVNKIEWCLNRARTKLEDIKDMRKDVKFEMVQ